MFLEKKYFRKTAFKGYFEIIYREMSMDQKSDKSCATQCIEATAKV